MEKGKLIIISGFSGTGKGTLIKLLMDRHPGRYAFSVSATTRGPRPGEVEGEAYYFVSHERFEAMLAEDQLLEHTFYSGNYYGTPAAPIDRMLSEGKNIVLDIEITGMHQVTPRRPDTLTVFLVPPSAGILVDRLTGRGTETPEQIRKRLTRATEEASFAREYGCILVNDNLETCADELENYIITGLQNQDRRAANLKLTADICEELKAYID